MTRRTRLLIAAGLFGILIVDLGYSFVLQGYVIKHQTKDTQTQQEKKPNAEGPFLVLGRLVAMDAEAVIVDVGEFIVDAPEVITALATVVMAVFTWRLWWSTDKLWKEAKTTSEIAKKSAEATLIQANAMMSAERAYVKMSHIEPGFRSGGLDSFEAGIKIENFGRTPAEITDVTLNILVLDAETPLTVVPEYSRPPEQQAFHALLIAGENFTVYPEFKVSLGDKAAVIDGEKTLYILGYVDYIDKFGRGVEAVTQGNISMPCLPEKIISF